MLYLFPFVSKIVDGLYFGGVFTRFAFVQVSSFFSKFGCGFDPQIIENRL